MDVKHNLALMNMPSHEEIKDTIFSLDPHCDSGLDGFTGKFYQICWDNIGMDSIAIIFCL